VFRSCPPTGRYEHWVAWESINPHVQAVLGYESTATTALAQKALLRAKLLSLVAEYDTYKGRLPAAQAKAKEALQLSQQFAGDDGEDTLVSLINMATALSNSEKFAEAEQIYRKVWESRKRALGDDAKLTLESMNSVAEVCRNERTQEGYKTSEEMQRSLLAMSHRTLGPEDSSTLKSMNNLAGTLSDLGKCDESEAMHRRVLALYQKGSCLLEYFIPPQVLGS